MSTEVDNKVEIILRSVINRLYEKEERTGLDYEDLRCFEIVSKIRKDNGTTDSIGNDIKGETDPDLLAELIRKARKFKPKRDTEQQ